MTAVDAVEGADRDDALAGWQIVRCQRDGFHARLAHAAVSSSATTLRGRQPDPSGVAWPVPSQSPAAS